MLICHVSLKNSSSIRTNPIILTFNVCHDLFVNVVCSLWEKIMQNFWSRGFVLIVCCQLCAFPQCNGSLYAPQFAVYPQMAPPHQAHFDRCISYKLHVYYSAICLRMACFQWSIVGITFPAVLLFLRLDNYDQITIYPCFNRQFERWFEPSSDCWNTLSSASWMTNNWFVITSIETFFVRISTFTRLTKSWKTVLQVVLQNL